MYIYKVEEKLFRKSIKLITQNKEREREKKKKNHSYN
jgi:hypothetical protein